MIFIQDYLVSVTEVLNGHIGKIGISETIHLNMGRSGRDSIMEAVMGLGIFNYKVSEVQSKDIHL